MSQAPVRVFVVDDHTLFREGLTRLLASDPRLEVVGGAGSSEEALAALAKTEVDVLIADYDLGTSTAVPLIAALGERGLKVKSLLVTAGVPNRDALELMRLGVAGILHKQRAPEELLRSILDVAEGKVVMDQGYFKSLVETAAVVPERRRLTERERTIMKLLLEGNSNKEIANRLGSSESAVKAGLQQLFAKTGVRSRSQLVRIALEELRSEL
jgi:two-component system, NarL family, nitrate/nitrite response regulator NarL